MSTGSVCGAARVWDITRLWRPARVACTPGITRASPRPGCGYHTIDGRVRPHSLPCLGFRMHYLADWRVWRAPLLGPAWRPHICSNHHVPLGIPPDLGGSPQRRCTLRRTESFQSDSVPPKWLALSSQSWSSTRRSGPSPGPVPACRLGLSPQSHPNCLGLEPVPSPARHCVWLGWGPSPVRTEQGC